MKEWSCNLKLDQLNKRVPVDCIVQGNNRSRVQGERACFLLTFDGSPQTTYRTHPHTHTHLANANQYSSNQGSMSRVAITVGQVMMLSTRVLFTCSTQRRSVRHHLSAVASVWTYTHTHSPHFFLFTVQPARAVPDPLTFYMSPEKGAPIGSSEQHRRGPFVSLLHMASSGRGYGNSSATSICTS